MTSIPATPTALPSAAPPSASDHAALEAKARTIGDDFESFFISAMLEQMSSGVAVDPVFGGGHGETVFRSLLNQEYGKVFVKSGGIGISKAIQDEIIRLQEHS
jgi:Rod binding domain-containing protein